MALNIANTQLYKESKDMKVWVSRDRIDLERCCGIHEAKKQPLLNEAGAYPVSNGDLTVKQFSKRYGFLPDRGSCKQMELSLTEIK